MEILRPYYRNVLVEAFILSAVAVQILSGAKRFVSARAGTVSRFEELQLWTGLYLAVFIVVHVDSVLAGRLLLNLDTNFYYGTAGLNTFPFSLFFIPYYAFLEGSKGEAANTMLNVTSRKDWESGYKKALFSNVT